MKKFAVGYMNFFDNDLIVEIIDAENWYEALRKHKSLKDEADEYFEEIYSDDMEEMKQNFFDGDQLFDVKEVS